MPTHHQNVKCPICGRQNMWHPDNAFKPFCSHRCKLIDLGEWASETRRIPGSTVDQFTTPHGETPDDLTE